MIGSVIRFVDGQRREFPPVSVRGLASLHAELAERRVAEVARDCKALGMLHEDTLARMATAREDSQLATSITRWAFTLEGARAIVSASVGADQADDMLDGLSPDDIAQVALNLIGFHWDDESSKWVRRSRATAAPNGGAIG